MLEIGSVIDGKYKILSEIGHGGMSVVYMAINSKVNKTWAVKEVRKNGVLDFESVRQGLIVETNMLKKLKHKSLPSIIDVIENDDSFLIIMDYIEGNSLAEMLAEEGAQPQEYVIEWAKQLCDVLEYLHTRTPAIIYRDMKPANVMIKPDGNVTLIDFGIAREYKEKNIADTACLGTLGYAAPEQFGGMGQTDARTDIYCLGATLYHVLTGNNPSEPPYEIKKIREVNPSLSSGLEKIIEKCTQRNPDDRFQSCAELAYALENYEKVDDEYKRKQRQKFAAFLATTFSAIIFLVCGIVTQQYAKHMASDNYAEILEEADKANTYEEQIALCKRAIDVVDKAGDSEAYLKLVEIYREDAKFDIKEQEELVKLIINHQADLKRDMNQYVKVCFETGKLFWYYYVDEADNRLRVDGRKKSYRWFKDVVSNAQPDYDNLGMAKVYASIGEFDVKIPDYIAQANDKGTYATLFDKMDELMKYVFEGESESEIVRLELLAMIRNALQQYATKFKNDGISKERQLELFDKINVYLQETEISADVTKEIKDDITRHLEDTNTAINMAYDA